MSPLWWFLILAVLVVVGFAIATHIHFWLIGRDTRLDEKVNLTEEERTRILELGKQLGHNQSDSLRLMRTGFSMGCTPQDVERQFEDALFMSRWVKAATQSANAANEVRREWVKWREETGFTWPDQQNGHDDDDSDGGLLIPCAHPA